MAAVSNLYIDQGADFSTTLSLTDSNGDILTLTGYSAIAQMRKTYDFFEITFSNIHAMETFYLQNKTFFLSLSIFQILIGPLEI